MRIGGSGAPGVFVRGLETVPLPPLAGAVTGLVGLPRRGPPHAPQALRSWGDYLTVCGTAAPWGYLGDSVFAFFANGGEQCWVVRALDHRVRAAENPAGMRRRVELSQPSQNDAPILDPGGVVSFSLQAIDPGSWGNDITYTIEPGSREDLPLTVLTQGTATTDTVLHVASVADIAAGVTLWIRHRDTPAVQQKRTVFSTDPTTNTVTLTGTLGSVLPPGSMVAGRGFRLVVRYEDREEVFDDATIAADHPRNVLLLVNGVRPSDQYLERKRAGNSILVRAFASGVAGARAPAIPVAPTPFAMTAGGDGGDYARAPMVDGAGQPALTAVARTPGRVGNSIKVTASAFGTSLALPAVGGAASTVITVAEPDGFRIGDSVVVGDSTVPGAFETVALVVVDPGARTLMFAPALANTYLLGAPVAVLQRFTLTIGSGTGIVEVVRNLSPTPALAAPYFVPVVNNSSALIGVDPPAAVAGAPVGTIALAGGLNPGEMPVRFTLGYEPDGSLSGGPDPQFGLAQLEAVPAVSLVAVPDLQKASDLAAPSDHGVIPAAGTVDIDNFVAAQLLILGHCRKMGERFAILDPPAPLTTPDQIRTWQARVADPQLGRFGAIYYPWLSVTRDSSGGPAHVIPPCGAITGSTARNDRLAGLSRGPANLALTGVVDVSVPMTLALQDVLYPLGVNCVRKLGDGVVAAWGARTLTADSPHRYVNVRRILLAVVKGLTQQLAWSVFEPNDSALWARIEGSLRAFLSALLVGGLTAGQTAAEAFFVRCDATTTPKDARDAGIVYADVGVALSAPAEFILLTVRRTPESLVILEADL